MTWCNKLSLPTYMAPPIEASAPAAVTFAQELHFLNRAGAMTNISSQLQTPKFCFFFCYETILQKMGRMLKPLMPKFRPDLSARLRDAAEKQVPANPKPIVVSCSGSV